MLVNATLFQRQLAFLVGVFAFVITFGAMLTYLPMIVNGVAILIFGMVGIFMFLKDHINKPIQGLIIVLEFAAIAAIAHFLGLI